MVTLAQIPSDSEAIAIAAKAGDLPTFRTARRSSVQGETIYVRDVTC